MAAARLQLVSKQIQFVCHIMKKKQLEATALTRKIEGKRAISGVDKEKLSRTGYQQYIGNS